MKHVRDFDNINENLKIGDNEYNIIRFDKTSELYYNNNGILAANNNFITWDRLMSIYQKIKNIKN